MKSFALPLLLCLLLLTGCTAPAEQVQVVASHPVSPIATVTALPTVTPAPHSTSMPTPKIPVADTDDYEFLPGPFLPLQETENVFFLWPAEAITSTLTGTAVSYTVLETFAEEAAAEQLFAADLAGALQTIGMDADFPPYGYIYGDYKIVDWAWIDELEGSYGRLHLLLEHNKGIDLFFRRHRDDYMPLYIKGHERLLGIFQFAGQDWALYTDHATGSGYMSSAVYWYNLSTCRMELALAYDLLDSWAKTNEEGYDAYETKRIWVLEVNPVENGMDSYLEAAVHLQLEAEYWDRKEGREVVELAPGPDTFAAETKLRLYYDQQAQAFYTRVMPEACPLADGMSDSLWRFYFDAQLQDLRTNGNTYQKRWAQTFYA